MGREFDRRTAILLAGAGLGIAATAFGQEDVRPKVNNPRATDCLLYTSPSPRD